MANRFDVLIRRIESQARGMPLSAPGDQDDAHGDRADAKPVRGAKSPADKQRAEHRQRHDA